MKSFNENWDGVVRKNMIIEQSLQTKVKKIAEIVKKYLMPINSMRDTGKVGNFVRLAKAWKDIDANHLHFNEDPEEMRLLRKAGVSAKHQKMIEDMDSWVAYEASPDNNRKMYRFHNLKPQDINDLWALWKIDYNIK